MTDTDPVAPRAMSYAEVDRAFNAGSDARRDGDPLAWNPCDPKTGLYDAWEAGWRSMNDEWGVEAWRLRGHHPEFLADVREE